MIDLDKMEKSSKKKLATFIDKKAEKVNEQIANDFVKSRVALGVTDKMYASARKKLGIQ